MNNQTTRIKLFCVITATIIFLSACSKHTQVVDHIEAYSDRLQSFTQISLAESNSPLDNKIAPPKKSELRIDIPQVNINLREFYALNDCSLNQLVAQRNTALGKMQQASTRYAYETSLLSEFDFCKQKLKANKDENLELISKLENWSDTKHKQLPSAYSNLITQSDEVYAHLFRATDYISGSEDDNFTSVKQALLFLLKAKDVTPIDLTALEYHLQQLDISPLMARKWRTQQYLTQELNNISVLLNEFSEANMCRTAEEEEQVTIMRNIFTKFFAETIQPLASELNKYHYQLSPILQEIIDSPNVPDALVNYVVYHEQTSYQEYSTSMREHIGIWQDIFARCS